MNLDIITKRIGYSFKRCFVQTVFTLPFLGYCFLKVGRYYDHTQQIMDSERVKFSKKNLIKGLDFVVIT